MCAQLGSHTILPMYNYKPRTFLNQFNCSLMNVVVLSKSGLQQFSDFLQNPVCSRVHNHSYMFTVCDIRNCTPQTVTIHVVELSNMHGLVPRLQISWTLDPTIYKSYAYATSRCSCFHTVLYWDSGDLFELESHGSLLIMGPDRWWVCAGFRWLCESDHQMLWFQRVLYC